jgi:hemerythrin-like domain-containing protein
VRGGTGARRRALGNNRRAKSAAEVPMIVNSSRRHFLTLPAAAGSAYLLDTGVGHAAEKPNDEVSPTEDLMIEHGVLRRALLVFQAAAGKIRLDPASVDPVELRRALTLFRTFGSEYHETALEEHRVFPTVREAGGPAAELVPVLIRQHNRGHEINSFVVSVLARNKITNDDGAAVADALDGFVTMYQHHAAREDTIVFPAWRRALSPQQFADMRKTFEDIERARFGVSGQDDAIKEIGQIEQALGLGDLAQLTPPRPPVLREPVRKD